MGSSPSSGGETQNTIGLHCTSQCVHWKTSDAKQTPKKRDEFRDMASWYAFSSYRPSFWSKPCAPLRGEIVSIGSWCRMVIPSCYWALWTISVLVVTAMIIAMMILFTNWSNCICQSNKLRYHIFNPKHPQTIINLRRCWAFFAFTSPNSWVYHLLPNPYGSVTFRPQRVAPLRLHLLHHTAGFERSWETKKACVRVEQRKSKMYIAYVSHTHIVCVCGCVCVLVALCTKNRL